MKLFRIDFKEVDYDQYDGFIVMAENEQEVEKIVKKEHPKEKWHACDWEGGFTIKEILLEGEPTILLGSFNAG